MRSYMMIAQAVGELDYILWGCCGEEGGMSMGKYIKEKIVPVRRQGDNISLPSSFDISSKFAIN